MAKNATAAVQPIDLAAFTSVDTLEVTILHPAFPAGAEPVITLAGPNHPATIAADRARQSAILKTHGRIDTDAIAVEHVAARIIGWRNVVIDGAQPGASPAAAKDLLTRPSLKFIRNQIFAALGDEDRFFTV